MDEIEKRFWESKRITSLDGTFAEFLAQLNLEIPVCADR